MPGSLGSVSVDGTWAQAKLDGFYRRGTSLRLQYSKDFTDSGTTFTLAGYRYATSGYLDFSEANGYYDSLPPDPRAGGDLTESGQALAERNYALWRRQHNKRSSMSTRRWVTTVAFMCLPINSSTGGSAGGKTA